MKPGMPLPRAGIDSLPAKAAVPAGPFRAMVNYRIRPMESGPYLVSDIQVSLFAGNNATALFSYQSAKKWTFTGGQRNKPVPLP